MNRLVVVLVLLCAGCADTTASIPSLPLAVGPACEAADAACMAANTTSFEVEGVRVLHRRIVGHPLVALQLKFDNLPKAGGTQYWSEALALDVLAAVGPRSLGVTEWNARIARMSASVRSSPGLDYRALSALAPRNQWRAMWALLMEGLHDPEVDDWYLDNRRGIRQHAFSSERDEPDDAAAAAALAQRLRGAPTNLPRETQADLASITSEELSAAWPALLNKTRVLVSLAGDLSIEEAEDVVRSGLGKIAADAQPAWISSRRELTVQDDPTVIPFADSPAWHIHSVFLGPPADRGDYPAFVLAIRVLSARLYDELRDARGLAYTTGASVAFYRQPFGSLWLTTSSPAAALPVVRTVIAQLKSEGPSDEELDAARATLDQELLSQLDTPAGIAWLQADWQLTVGDFHAVDVYRSGLTSTSREEVAAALHDYLTGASSAAAGGGSELSKAELGALFE